MFTNLRLGKSTATVGCLLGLFLVARAIGRSADLPDRLRKQVLPPVTEFQYLLPAARRGSPSAQFTIGWCYEHGHDVKKSLRLAATWYRRSAKQGYARAQCDLGWLYLRGKGVSKDLGRAAKWLELAAKQQDAVAQFDMGLIELSGSGVQKELLSNVVGERISGG